jgi:hypothetical protein
LKAAGPRLTPLSAETDGSQREFVTTSRESTSLSRQLDGVSRRSVSVSRQLVRVSRPGGPAEAIGQPAAGKTCLLN